MKYRPLYPYTVYYMNEPLIAFLMLFTFTLSILPTVIAIIGGIMLCNREEYARQLYNAVVEYMDSLANPQNFQRLNDAILHLNEDPSSAGFPEVGRELKILAFQISEARGQIVMLIAESGDHRPEAAGDAGALPAASKKLLRDIVDIANCIAAMILELSELCEANESAREICAYVMLVNEVVVEAITHLRNERAAIASLLEGLLRSSEATEKKPETGRSRYCIDTTGRIIHRSGDNAH